MASPSWYDNSYYLNLSFVKLYLIKEKIIQGNLCFIFHDAKTLELYAITSNKGEK